MIRFSWKKFCDGYRVPYVTSGPNTADGNISIRCPWCGNADPSQHMGLSLSETEPFFGCLRNDTHRGRNPARLIARLLNIRISQAQALVGENETPIDEFQAAVGRLRPKSAAQPAPKGKPALSVPVEFRRFSHPLDWAKTYEHRFLDYLDGRGFDGDAINIVAEYPLWWAVAGEQRWRIIFAILNANKQLIGWTGRSLFKEAPIRYLTSEGMGKDVLLHWCHDKKPRAIIVVEGPMDALKLDYFGFPDIAAVATLGTGFTEPQVAQLRGLAKKTGAEMFTLFDPEAVSSGLRIADEIGAHWLSVPPGIEDAGAMTPMQANDFLKGLRETMNIR